MWLVYTKSSIANAPGGGFWTLSLSAKLLDQPPLHEMLQEQLEGGHHRTLQWIEDETYCGESGCLCRCNDGNVSDEETKSLEY